MIDSLQPIENAWTQGLACDQTIVTQLHQLHSATADDRYLYLTRTVREMMTSDET